MKSNKKYSGIVCPNCGGTLSVDESDETLVCQFCGAVHQVADLLDESDEVRAQRIRSDAYKDVELGWQKVESEKIQHAREKQREKEKKEEVAKFKKSLLSKIIIAFTIISWMSCFVAFSGGYTASGVVAVIQTIIYALAWLMGMGIIKEKKRSLHTAVFFVGVLLAIPYISMYSSNPAYFEKKEPIVWSNIALSDVIPAPPNEKGKIRENTKTSLRIYTYGDTAGDYSNYVDQCRQAGFTVDVNEHDSSFDGYNEEGYRLKIDYYDFDGGEINLHLSAPVQFVEMAWPDSPLGKLLPKPESNLLYRQYETEDSLDILVSETSFEEYNLYVSKCIDCGFGMNLYRQNRDFSAESKEQYRLSISYEGNNIMQIRLWKKS